MTLTVDSSEVLTYNWHVLGNFIAGGRQRGS